MLAALKSGLALLAGTALAGCLTLPGMPAADPNAKPVRHIEEGPIRMSEGFNPILLDIIDDARRVRIYTQMNHIGDPQNDQLLFPAAVTEQLGLTNSQMNRRLMDALLRTQRFEVLDPDYTGGTQGGARQKWGRERADIVVDCQVVDARQERSRALLRQQVRQAVWGRSVGVDRERGRFRSYLLGALRHYLANERARASTLKRGGGQAPVPLAIDRQDAEGLVELRDDRTPEDAYARAWAEEILRRARERLRERYDGDGQAARFDALEPFLLDADTPRYRELAERLAMSEANARVAVHRLRTRFGTALREEVAQTVSSDAEIDDELRAVIEAVRG